MFLQHLDEQRPDGVVNEAVQQVAFADKILLNKIDLVSPEEKAEVRRCSQSCTCLRNHASDTLESLGHLVTPWLDSIGWDQSCRSALACR